MYKLTDTKSEIVICNSNSFNFLDILKTKWDNLHDENDVFRYKIDNLRERIVDEKYLLQLNPDRGINRRAPEVIDKIYQPFDENKFNFTKVLPREILFNLSEEGNDLDIHSFIVNASPISRYHTLLCPSVNRCLPQIANEEDIRLVLDIMFLAIDRNLRIAFNSLCAKASVNHLHYHLLLEKTVLPIETVICKHLIGPVYYFEDSYPAQSFCFEVTSQQEVYSSSKYIIKLINHLMKNSIPHNIFFTKGQSVRLCDKHDVVRVIVWPRKSSFGVKHLEAFTVAAVELSGWFPVYDKKVYESLKTEDLEKELRKWQVDNFKELCENVKKIFT